MAAFETQPGGILVPGFGLGSVVPPSAAHYSGQPSPPYTIASNSTLGSDPFELRPTKKQRLSTSSSSRRASADQPQAQPHTANGTPAATKSKRVRTGCLTCRERHLKCDEATPDCINCRKSNRECKRGVRLNFIDVQIKSPPYIPLSDEWIVQFQDESRLIASEYQGGLMRYAGADQVLLAPPRPADERKKANSKNTRAQQQRIEKQDAVIAALMAAENSKPQQPQIAPGNSSYYTQPAQQLDDTFGTGNMHTRHNSEVSLVAPPSAHPAVYGLQLQDPFGTMKEDLQRGNCTYRDSPASTPGSMVTHTARPPSSIQGGLDSRQASPPDGVLTPPQDSSGGSGGSEEDGPGSESLTKPEEVQYMQVFVEEVGPWMDSMDRYNHFSNIIPYRAARSPMLMNAFLACGVRHLTLVNPEDEKLDATALVYYNTASTLLLRNLQNPDRDMVECATTACVLNVFEIMSERPTERMNHIAGARALIRECGWDAQSKGIGAACFWLNVGMEVLSCLAFNWKCSWEPDQWGVDMGFGNTDGELDSKKSGLGDFDEEGDDVGVAGAHGDEEIWVHRMFYIVAKIANFRASIPVFQEACPLDEQMRLQARYADWDKLHELCRKWNACCPKTMKPFGYVSKSGGKSKFPNVWLIKRPAVVGRLFYHTAQCILAQCNPLIVRDDPASVEKSTHHARQVCGIVAHTRDKGVASISIRSLAIASACLTEREEQTEVISILDRIHSETGWRLGKVHIELKKAWGWDKEGRKNFAAAAGMPAPNSTMLSSAMGTGSIAAPHSRTMSPAKLGSTVRVASSSGIKNHSQPRSRPSPSLRHQEQERERERQRQQAHAHQQHQIAAAQQFFSVTSRAMPLQIVAASVQSIAQPSPKVPVPITQLGSSDNPLVAADFSLPNHPYTGFYQPPTNRNGAYSTHRGYY
ncbi:hypothetical protein MKZ38_008015 [Zalerion maritima]|uniref:Zn(2)-C6 fungal-type domain-containing protein n=1 Tax=Zalerion maritima TaxID=339359 RepID=A0AAD5RUH6_9PEZI|nr:hypothetical protein MKZ38_008015 [Zalerion maritima]